MFTVDIAPTLEALGFTVNGNGNVMSAKLHVTQNLIYKDHAVIAAFILNINDERRVQTASCNIQSISHSSNGWEEYNDEVEKILKIDACRNLKNIVVNRGK